jgi:hypothetical protein
VSGDNWRICPATDRQVLELDRFATRCADCLHMQLAAAPVGELDSLCAVSAPTIPPLLQRKQDWHKVPARVGEHILLPRWAFAVLATRHDVGIAKPGEPARQDTSRSSHLCGEVDEPAVSIEQLPHDLQRVAVAEHGQSVGNRAFSRRWFGLWTHACYGSAT